MPATADFVGLIRVGTWVEQLAPELDEQPIRMVTVVPLATIAVVVVQVIVFAEREIANEHAADPAEKLAFISLVGRPLNENIAADGEA